MFVELDATAEGAVDDEAVGEDEGDADRHND